MSFLMHLYELLACFTLISGVLVCVVLHPYLQVCGIYQETPRREVVRSSAGASVIYPPFLGSFA